MSFVLVRPTAQHNPGNVNTATTQDGLSVSEPAPDSGNGGNLRLRASGVPTTPETLLLSLSAGGFPAGYDTAAVNGYLTGGAAIQWYRASESSSLIRGYTDTPRLTSAMIPLTYSATMGATSTPRELADGYLGIAVADTSTRVISFWRISPTGSASSSVVGNDVAAASGRPDFVVLPSGRLVCAGASYSSGYIFSRYSDDNGATWSVLGTMYNTSAGGEVTCMEVVGDEIVMVSAPVASGAASIWVSRDGGSTFALSATTTLANPRTCVLDGVIFLTQLSATTMWVYPLLPGGGLGAAVNTSASSDTHGIICARDDGTLWVGGWTTTTLALEGAASADGGATWSTLPAKLLDGYGTAYATNGYSSLSAGMWGARMVVAGRVDSNGASDGGVHLLIYGEWSNVDQPAYFTLYTPIDYPQNQGWTKTDTGAGATVTNTGPLRLVTTVANCSIYTAPLHNWAPSAGDTVVVGWGLRVNSGGSLAANQIRLSLTVDDGANTQGLNIRFTTTGARCYDTTGAQVGTDLSVTMTDYVEFRAIMVHDYTAGVGKATIHYRAMGSETWTTWINAQTVTEQAGAAVTQLRFGGTTAAATSSDWLYVATNDSALLSYLTPATPVGRTLSAAYDYRVVSGLNLGAYGTGGLAGDTYTLTTPYTYGADRVWTELRPSMRCQSTADNTTWELDLDAGDDLFHGDVIAVFATNFRTASWQMSDSNVFATTPINVTLDATITTFTIAAGGKGYLRATGKNWRPGQWKSNGDSRRYFASVSGTVYEIADNDETRLYITGVDLSAAAGSVIIFGDRMAAVLPQHAMYRYARLYVSSQDTADGAYRVGTPIFDRGFTPAQLYDFGFVDRLEPNVTTTDADNGSSLSYRRGPALASLSIQWPPLDKLRVDAEDRIADFYRACEGSLTPVVLWRDTGDITTLSLVQIREVLTRTNVRGEGATALTRIDQLVLREVW